MTGFAAPWWRGARGGHVSMLACAVVLAAAPAGAYCRTHTCQVDDDCEVDDDGCYVGGVPLYWPRRCISSSVHELGSPLRGITPDAAEAALAVAYSTWTTSDCGEGKPPTMEVWPLERVSCDRVEGNRCDKNANIWVFRDDEWPYDDGGLTLALTTVHFDPETGELIDADVEVNTAGYPITVDDPGGRSQFIAISTHEIGHVFGLDHSPNPDATMYASYARGRDISSLSPDDVAGLCAICPPDRDVGPCDPEPYNGFSAECGTKECSPSGGCCATTPGRRVSGAGWLVVLGGLSLAVWRARSRRRSR